MGYDAVIFDFDGVIIDTAFDGYRWAEKTRKEKARELGYEVKDLDGKGYLFSSESYEELRKKVDRSPLTMEEYLEVEKAVSQRKLEMVKSGDMEVMPGVEEVLQELQVPKSIASNGYGDSVEKIVSYLGIDRFFSFKAAPRLREIERYHSIMKPETIMLEKAIASMDATNPVMVGDNWFDIEAANRLDIDSVFINNYNREIDVEPNHRISSLRELKDIV